MAKRKKVSERGGAMKGAGRKKLAPIKTVSFRCSTIGNILLAAVNIFQTIDELSIKAHIAAKKDVKEHYQRLWQNIVELNGESLR